TLTSGVDSALKYMLQFETNTPYKGNLISIYLQQGNKQAAQDVYDSIVAEQPGSNYQVMYGILIDIDGKNIQQELISDQELFETVTTIANDSSDMNAFIMAQSLLNMIQLRTYKEPIMSMVENNSERKTKGILTENNSPYKLNNFPNP